MRGFSQVVFGDADILPEVGLLDPLDGQGGGQRGTCRSGVDSQTLVCTGLNLQKERQKKLKRQGRDFQ